MPVRATRRLAAASLLLAVLLAPVPDPPAAASSPPAAEAPPPEPWPASPSASPRIEGFAHGVRIAGADRYSTNLALALTLRGTGGFPFSTPDRSAGGVGSLAEASGWWGVGRCPRSVIVVAADSPADALAASALSDPTDLSSEPYLRRSAAADPVFDPPGAHARVDTDSAPILVTRSARQGATSLSTPTRIAAGDLRAGGCTLARQAIVVGGTAAVPAGVEAELLSLGYHEVFRVAGADRYATAAAVARSLGTAAAPGGSVACADPSSAGGAVRMGFYANSVVELRDSPESCRLLGRSVVLADGVTGADALAAGWWTSFWQVPVLLHDGSGRLPAATASALGAMAVDHVVVLGGAARIGEAVAAQAVELTGAQVVRIAGPDRYATSVEMARRLGGWWPAGEGAGFEASLVCLAASGGEGAAARGWPDALAAGPWCAAAGGAAANPGPPERALAPTAGAAPRSSTGGPDRPGRDAVPVLLVPAGAQSLPSSVAGLLAGAFDEGERWCSSAASVAGCVHGGFVVGIGGAAVLSDAALSEASRLVSGIPQLDAGDRAPRLDPTFHTRLEMEPVFGTEGSGAELVCAERGGYVGLRWLAVFAGGGAALLHAGGDLMLGGRYASDADGVARSAGSGSPSCVAFAAPPGDSVTIRGVSLSGRATAPEQLLLGAPRRFELSGWVTSAGPQAASGLDSDRDPAGGGSTVRTFVTSSPGVEASSRGDAAAVGSAALTVTINRGMDQAGAVAPDRFSATWSLSTAAGSVSGTAWGEAVLAEGVWQLRGRAGFSGGSWNVASGSGGFSAELATNTPGDPGDDAISWRLDGLVSG